jgi:hypothetical protein
MTDGTDPVFSRLAGDGKAAAPMVTVAFRIPEEYDTWARELAKTLGLDKSVVLRELMRMGWEQRLKTMSSEPEHGS